jgi:hypothetical protein
MRRVEKMENEYRHLECGLTEIVCYYHDEKKFVYIDTHNFEKVDAFPGRWRVHRPGGKFCIINTKSGKTSDSPLCMMHRVIAGDDRNTAVIHVNEDPFDLREENLLSVTIGTTNHPGTKAKIEKMLAKQRPLKSLLKNNLSENREEDHTGVDCSTFEKEKQEAKNSIVEAKQSVAAARAEELFIEKEKSSVEQSRELYIKIPSGEIIIKENNKEISSSLFYHDLVQIANFLSIK